MKKKAAELIQIRGAKENNLKNIDLDIERNKITVITGLSGAGKSSLAFDIILKEAQHRFFDTLSHYSRQFLDLGSRPDVKSITGLSPAISLAQFETKASVKATVGTLTEISELLGVLMSEYGEAFCPKHDLSTKILDKNHIFEKLIESFTGQSIVVCAPLVEMKKGSYKKLLARFAEKGFVKALIDGKTCYLTPTPELDPEKKHTIKLIVDQLKVGLSHRKRLENTIDTALQCSNGYIECIPVENKKPIFQKSTLFSTKGSCQMCGYSPPKLDSRYFSANSLGKCSKCKGLGVKDIGLSEPDIDAPAELHSPAEEPTKCMACEGTGLDPKLKSIRLGPYSSLDLQQITVEELANFLATNQLATEPAFVRITSEIKSRLERLSQLGLSYLSLCRRIHSLSGGEHSRLKLSGILSESLRGVLYILDEPSQGLHPSEIASLVKNIKELRDLGNTVLIVDHDQDLIRECDWIVELGPGGGTQGGSLSAKFSPSQAQKFTTKSVTAKFLLPALRPQALLTNFREREQPKNQYITLTKPTLNNLKLDQVRFLHGHINVVTGLSGAGKTSLVMKTLYPNATKLKVSKTLEESRALLHCDAIKTDLPLKQVTLIDRNPIAKSSVSMPATYLDVFGDIRQLFAKLPDSAILGYTAATFSLHREGGRCEECKGRGETIVKMRFLADNKERCSFCKGNRYRSHLKSVKYRGHSIIDILNLTLTEALELFRFHKKIARKLQPAVDLGLGYLKLGQPTASLSGGESQRLKLTEIAVKKDVQGSLILIDEPTLGLHPHDTDLLMRVLKKLRDEQASLVIIEHERSVIKEADWIIELGPGAAKWGGDLVHEGTLHELRNNHRSNMREFFFPS